ncbi:MAG TPA: DCC1-like thiol-disulfide oxidoreductase family protein [Mucilaginibacter sp.]|jgi:predicted DCC family thiol-disulfide oxidoreductase YuxK|nr:DCC1-like thiol-disulfide oxidoreductase family protein [Mucilaginibacter sp.]
MKTLNNHIILYDAECPICTRYTKALTNRGMLEQGGWASYQQMPAEVCPMVDRQRAVDEIALVDVETGEVNYGVKSLFKVFGNSFPLLKPLFSFGPFVWVMSKAYAFFSFNRRVIIPSNTYDKGLQPTFRFGYRLAYLLLSWLAVGFILTRCAALLTTFIPLGSPYREYAICGGQILFQGIIVSFYAPKKRWDYLGNMMTISFAGALLLIPVVLLHHLIHWPLFFPLYFMLVAGLMFLEHIRRTKLLALGWLLTITWALYRIILLLIILNLI